MYIILQFYNVCAQQGALSLQRLQAALPLVQLHTLKIVLHPVHSESVKLAMEFASPFKPNDLTRKRIYSTGIEQVTRQPESDATKKNSPNFGGQSRSPI